ncbi:hypothetical protein J2T21_004073 [Paeniglutamicibacter psychrophenolicus]|nr:hypothetical protein [Paeniglutamicibacter psychrophenolicus]
MARLGVHRVGGDDHPGQRREMVHEYRELRDLVAFLPDSNLSQHRVGVLVDRRQQVDPASLAVLRPAHFIPVHGKGHRPSQALGPVTGQQVKRIGIQAFQHPGQGGRVRGSDPAGGQLGPGGVGGPLGHFHQRL